MEHLTFDQFGLSPEIKKAVDEMGFEEATPIQSQTIPVIFEGVDIIGQAQTGTGKTAAFGIPTIEAIEPYEKNVRAIILCPTRELAIQVAEDLKDISKHKKGVFILPVYGGQPIERQIRGLKKGAQIIIGTPGRVIDHIKRGTLKLHNVEKVILDEADEMLDMGFRDDIESILSETPKERQTLLFSATMPKPILELTKRYQRSPRLIKITHKQLTVPNVEQIYFEIRPAMKLEVLCRLIDIYNPGLSLVFCNTKKMVDELVGHLQARGYFADGLHGDLKQWQRDRVMEKFRQGVVEILIATDVAARGLDIDDIEIVFNYDIPQDEEIYVHRIGRTARAGKPGKAISFVVGREAYKLRNIQNFAKITISRQKIPTINDAESIKTELFLEKIAKIIDEGHLGKYISMAEKLIAEDFTSTEIAAALFKLQLEHRTKDRVEYRDSFEDTGGAPGMARLFINIGRTQNVMPRDIIGAIAGETGISGKLIGKIDIFDKFTFVEVPAENAEEVLLAMKNNRIKSKKINIEPANRR